MFIQGDLFDPSKYSVFIYYASYSILVWFFDGLFEKLKVEPSVYVCVFWWAKDACRSVSEFFFIFFLSQRIIFDLNFFIKIILTILVFSGLSIAYKDPYTFV